MQIVGFLMRQLISSPTYIQTFKLLTLFCDCFLCQTMSETQEDRFYCVTSKMWYRLIVQDVHNLSKAKFPDNSLTFSQLESNFPESSLCILHVIFSHLRRRRVHFPKEISNQRTNGPINAHLRPEIYIYCINKLV